MGERTRGKEERRPEDVDFGMLSHLCALDFDPGLKDLSLTQAKVTYNIRSLSVGWLSSSCLSQSPNIL
jgi:hypothetical protein